MAKIPSYLEADAGARAMDELIQQALADGVHPSDLCTALTVAAVRLGLQFAPNAAVAFAVVMKAAGNAAVEWAATPATSAEEHSVLTAPIRTTMH